MRLAICLAAILAASVSVMADAVRITSPDHAQTFVYGEMISHQLYFDRTSGELAARVTFSNSPYADSNEPRSNESFDFRFPHIQFASARRVLFARSGHDELIPIAQLRKFPSCWVDLGPGTKIYLVKESGRVTATLTATTYPRFGERWVPKDNNFSLQNILIALFGELVSSDR